ncbi:MAG TPA: hypothetical protein DHW02_03535 [Ktedonobacter sp.]|nr:hypothetical protein [Ktedonobacter sp.]
MRDHLFEVDTTPPFLDTTRIMQRADEVGAIQRMLTDPQTMTVVLVGNAGTGKSTLAALLYHRLLMAKNAGLPAPHHLVWLRMSAYTTFPDMLAGLLKSLHAPEPDFALLKPQQQISSLLRAFRRNRENALVVLDQFEELVHSERKELQDIDTHDSELSTLFFEMLQTNLGNSRVLLTSREMLFDEQNSEGGSVRSYLVSRISTPEGTALLQRYGLNASSEELSMIWQRCSGLVFALVLFCALVHVSDVTPTTLLHSNEYQALWQGDVLTNLIALLFRRVTLMQRHMLRGLSLFDEPVPQSAVMATMSNGNQSLDKVYGEQFINRFNRELQTLAQLSVLQVVSLPDKEMRFALHPVLRQYILEHYIDVETENVDGQGVASLGVSGPLNPMQTNPEAQHIALAAGHRQVANYYCALMKEQYPPREQRTGLQDVTPLIAAIRHLCLGYQWQAASDLLFAEGLHQSLPRWGAWRTLAGLYVALISPSGMIQRRDEGLVTSLLATLYGQLGDYSQSQNYFDRALAIQHEVKDVRGEAVTLANRGELCRMHGETAQAQQYFEQAIALGKSQNVSNRQDIHLRSIVLHNMGLLYHIEKEYATAFNCYIHALRLTYQLQEQYDKGTILTNLGLLLYEQGRHRESFAVLLAALHLRQSLQDSGTTLLARFLFGVEQKMGAEAYKHLCEQAIATQEEVFAQLMATQTPA